MTSRTKNALYSLFLLLAIGIVWLVRKYDRETPIKLEGKTMGTTYHITYFDPAQRNFQVGVDSLLIVLNKSINTYDSTSEISIFNRSLRSLRYTLPYLYPALKKSQEVVSGSRGAYDPTVMPLVNAWGFGPRRIERPDTAEIIALRQFVGFEMIGFNTDSVWKTNPNVQLDFGGIGQGYGADVVANFLRSKAIRNFFVELGGEGVAQGENLREGRSWEIGILDPESKFGEMKFTAYASLHNQGYSTSGNYFNYREVDGRKYSHTIDPASGFPVQRELLSATVIAADCATADAWATAFMVMGHVAGQALLKKHPELDVIFIYSSAAGTKTFVSERLSAHVKVQP